MEEKSNKISLPLLITKKFIITPGPKEERIDASREFSVKAIDSARDEHSSLLIVVAQKQSEIEIPTFEDIFHVGVLCRITSFANMRTYVKIKIVGTRRVKIDSVAFDQNGYFLAEATVLEDVVSDERLQSALVKEIIHTLENDQTLWGNIPRGIIADITVRGVEPGALPDLISPYLLMSTEQRQALLEAVDVATRLRLLLECLNEKKVENAIDQKIQSNVAQSAEKAQRDYILREKMKAIKKELGEDEETGDDVDSIKARLEKEPYPEHVKKKVLAELKRYEMLPQASLEASLQMSYIMTLMQVPWYQRTIDNDDLESARKILDEDHYGLTKVKKRILEYLAVKKMTGNLKAPIICFYGPPGCGKTSLGKSIARALGRKFLKASLGGISDEAEIRGHRRTYVGSMPGRIIAGMKRVGVMNPVFLLDEVDKLASSYKGDPSSALLEVLDPEQNFAFNDNYLEEPYDLSDVLFICTANYLDNVPAPLRDRLELIEVSSYTELEKVEIAKHFLYKKQLEANGLKKEQVTFTDDAYRTIIEKYTREAGVRELERKIASIMRKVVVDLLTKKDLKSVAVDDKTAEKYLGTPIFESLEKETKDSIGVVTGLAYTEYGGEILPIEVNYFPGKGGLVLTGKLGDVMKESCTIALDYTRSNADRYKIPNEIFKKNDIHIHVPEGAVPKDGPSAGVAITTAIISCLTHKKVRHDVAMTGEVTLRGFALPIGGLREKSLAALRNGIRTIIVPEKNRKNFEELPKEVKDALRVVYMESVDDAVKVAIIDE